MADKKEPSQNGDKTVRVTCETAASLPLDDMVSFQGNLKSLSEKGFARLRASVIKYGLSFPSFIWQNEGADSIMAQVTPTLTEAYPSQGAELLMMRSLNFFFQWIVLFRDLVECLDILQQSIDDEFLRAWICHQLLNFT